MKQKEYIVILDDEINYAVHLMEYLLQHRVIPCEIRVFTQEEKLLRWQEKDNILLLIVSESEYSQNIATGEFRSVLILNETEKYLGEETPNISKFQSMKHISAYIFEHCLAAEELSFGSMRHRHRMKIIGRYTPVSRCLQTTFSLTLGQILAEEAKVLYLNFENFSGLEQMLGKSFRGSVSDLLYYNECAREKISSQLQMMTEQIGRLCFVPSMKSYIELRAIRGGEWISLFHTIEMVTDYDYLLLDLSESIDGLFDILRECHEVYSITRQDGFSSAKMEQYEMLLKSMDYQDICAKTRHFHFPVFRELPAELEYLTHGEQADYIRRLIRQGIGGECENHTV